MTKSYWTLNPDQTLDFHFKSFDEPDTLNPNDDRVTVFDGTGKWRTVGDEIEITFKKAEEDFNYKIIFESEEKAIETVNDSTFTFAKDREDFVFWELSHSIISWCQCNVCAMAATRKGGVD